MAISHKLLIRVDCQLLGAGQAVVVREAVEHAARARKVHCHEGAGGNGRARRAGRRMRGEQGGEGGLRISSEVESC